VYPDSCGVTLTTPLYLALIGAARAIVLLLTTNAVQAQDPGYFPTTPAAVDKMLSLADVKAADFVIDLGCGDGRINVTAARRNGARGLGVDFDPQRIAEAEENARKAGVADKVTFRKENLFDTDISQATVLTLYLSLKINIALRPRILQRMKPGTRVLSNDFNMGDWLPDRWERVENRVVYLWVVPVKAAGDWRVTYASAGGARSFDLALAQQFQQLSGSATSDGRVVPIRDAVVAGERVGFAVHLGNDGGKRFDGRLVDGRLEGDGWTATRK
jgi:SAM-dependent methyltransferase